MYPFTYLQVLLEADRQDLSHGGGFFYFFFPSVELLRSPGEVLAAQLAGCDLLSVRVGALMN